MASGPIRRKTEKAVRDRAGVPVTLLYDETNDKTIMARSRNGGEQFVSDKEDYWNQYRYSYDGNGNLEYRGKHIEFDAASSDTNFLIIKFSYDGSDNLILVQSTTGSWDGRAALGW
jgi:hypothetical protein